MGFDSLFKDKLNSVSVIPTPAVQGQSELVLDVVTKKLVEMIQTKEHELGKVSDTFYRIPVPIGDGVETWEYSSALERDINVTNFQEHVINISDSICKWNTASSIYGEILAARELAYNMWYIKQMYMVRTNNVESKKLTESALKEICLVNNYAEYAKMNMELINLRAMKEMIDDAIIKSLFEKSKQLITLGAQLRQEYSGPINIK